MRISLGGCFLLLVFGAFAGGAPAAATTYTVADVGIVVTGINASGVACGYADAGGSIHAFRWSAGVALDLGTLGGNYSEATGINSSGQIVGYSTRPDGLMHAFLWTSGTMRDLGTLHGGSESRAYGINDAGQIVGYGDTTPVGFTWPAPEHAFIVNGGTMTDIGSLGTVFAVFSHATAINASGQVVGWSNTDTGDMHAFRWSGGAMTDLGTLGGSASGANAINASGVVVGWSYTAGDTATHAFRSTGGSMTDLGTVPGCNASTARGINSTGVIVGDSVFSGTPAFVAAGGAPADLNGMLAASGWSLRSAIAVNDAGQILCKGFNEAFTATDFILTPVAAGPDRDGDTVPDASDDCELYADASQQDTDADGLGDACEFAWGDLAPSGAPNGRVDVADVVRMLRFAVNLETPTAGELNRANIAPATIITGSTDTATPTLAAPRIIDITDAVLALRVSVNRAVLTAPY